MATHTPCPYFFGRGVHIVQASLHTLLRRDFSMKKTVFQVQEVFANTRESDRKQALNRLLNQLRTPVPPKEDVRCSSRAPRSTAV
ncbi:hypothetical protein D7Y41_13295 [Anaerotruncus sp. 1XD22-93]|nr:hypothetical protein [Anaerotruncus sp. 1XD42-93]RKJ93899.1 hypothetical protein D7Y41_13295 [Anaerotruncus sp. 1XD22-93]